MIFFRFYAPPPALQSFVRHYHIIHIQLDPKIPRDRLPVKPYPPNTEQCLYFYPFDLPHSVKEGNQQPERPALSNVMGQPLSRGNITINTNYLMLKVSFQPGGLFRLLGVPMYELTDSHADLEAITGRAAREITERLPEAMNYVGMIEMVEQFLLKKAAQCRQAILPIDVVAQQMLGSTGYTQLDRLAADACLSTRQFERKFRERLGVSPKLFARIARFGHAYKLRQANPDQSWLDIAYSCNYYDPNHLIKDFQQFAGTNPSQLFAEEVAHQQQMKAYAPQHYQR